MSDAAAVEWFQRNGYLVVRGFWPAAECALIEREVREALDPVLGPVEYEAEVGYPGAPLNRSAPGGDTPRRLLFAYSRFPALRRFAIAPALRGYLAPLLKADPGSKGVQADEQGNDEVLLSQCHHNCVMTKAPGFSSATLWHQDVRYWSFAEPALISAWLALGVEHAGNGALQVIPGTHREAFAPERLDDRKFLRPDLPANAALIASACTIELAVGDLLLFHCRTFHAAGRNASDAVKLSPVFTYRGGANPPLPGTRSSAYPDIPL